MANPAPVDRWHNASHRLAEAASGEWVLPDETGYGPPTQGAFFWCRTKAPETAAIVADSRLYDLWHDHASYAVMVGESLYVAGRLLEHLRASTNNCHVLLDDTTLSRTAEPVALAIRRNYTDIRHSRLIKCRRRQCQCLARERPSKE